MENWDFAGYATRYDVECGDGRVIRHHAFEDMDGAKIPMVFNHDHNNPGNVLGHAYLESRDDGMYAYGYFNSSAAGLSAKEAVQHGDVESLSIFANKLKERGQRPKEVMHGVIRELSLVLAGANPGAYIDQVSIAHGEDGEYEANIYSGEQIVLYHSADTEKADEKGEEKSETGKSVDEVIETMNEEQKKILYGLVGEALKSKEGSEAAHSEDETEDDLSHADNEDMTVKAVIDSMNENQKKVLYAMVAKAMESAKGEAAHSDMNDEEGEENYMKHNAFEDNFEDVQYEEEGTMQHSMDDIRAAIADFKKYGSMRDAFLAHGIDDLRIAGEETYGVKGIASLYPEPHSLFTPPKMIDRDQNWVSDILGNVKHTPFARIKTMFADITADEARAKGYTKGNKKIEEVFSLLKRITNPTTIYKKQALDRDDMVDITEFNVVAWIRQEMQGKMDEEFARAILLGDGRLISHADKIDEQCIRPVWTDNDLFTIKEKVTVATGADDDTKARAFIKSVIKTRKKYKGSGTPTLYTTEDMLAMLLLIEDKNGRFVYTSEDQLAKTLRVKKIVTVPVMEGLKDGEQNELIGIIVNMNDYNVGTDKNGTRSFFEDFDIDYNKMKYLYEERHSGCLITPYSAMAFHLEEASA